MTADLRPKWLNVTRSLQKAACKNAGVAVVSANIVVDAGGDPVTWTEPDIKRLGPLSSQSELIQLISGLSPSESYEEYLIAKVLDGRKIAINKGLVTSGIVKLDWFAYIQDNVPCAIFNVNEVRDRITILEAVWIGPQKNIIKLGDPVLKLSW